MNTAAEEHEQPPSLTDWLVRWRLDLQLLLALMACGGLGLFVLYSASGEQMSVVISQSIRLGIGFAAMIVVAQIPPDWYRTVAPWTYLLGLILLLLVLLLGDAAMGAQRWLDLGVVRFQPSEIMKIAVPLATAAFLHERALPTGWEGVIASAAIVAVPVGLVAIQPDLGTALLIVMAGGFVVFLAGLRWRVLALLLLMAAAAAPLVWFNMHEYQQERVLTFLSPARDPAGAGYHITQSKIAIGSGGLFGKGWLNGSQSHLNFLPESDTDFIFAVFAEEAGLLGVIALLALYGFLVARGLRIAVRSQDTFQRLMAGSISLTFFIYVFVNMGMVIGLLPVVGVPLPLLSFGGTSMVVLLMGFGILMSINTHRKLLSS
ncbi:rod shape-determining protein RodA [Salinisphaera sp. P385]|uniref:Peptidoglycan glycosyltransferase MrdB n=1 Tax=Spectribacter acetivorans TaxID=3075603 RepID=A0ABU3B9F2_9GAMM|nr:rod shape-determining protein RodA [Salinisphaera sp. P385]MDT0619105.1 rod shape-determining protein RodA [Salinisphaera sp. P385]